MEDLREKVYECTLAVEAHMICDLLARAGISARVDGEFLAGAGGDLPLGSTIKVRVDPSRAAEAREVIDEWERIQPPLEPGIPARPSTSRVPAFSRQDGDNDFDGRFEVESDAKGGRLVTSTLDSNGDGRPDSVSHLQNGVVKVEDIYDEAGRRIVARYHFIGDFDRFAEFDDDGDGTFERRVDFDRYGEPKSR